MSDPTPEVLRSLQRRAFLMKAGAGTVITALGGTYVLAGDALTREARAQTRADGRPRLPPGQKVIRRLKPMGGRAGDPNPRHFRLKIHGEVDRPMELDFRELRELETIEQVADVHCVTGWSVLGSKWTGVHLRTLAELVGIRPTARHVIFEAAHGYTANVRRADALDKSCMVAWELDGRPLPRPHGPPVRALVPDLYFWKSAKWLTGIRFVRRDQPGYWEARGYHNRADPWLEQRHA